MDDPEKFGGPTSVFNFIVNRLKSSGMAWERVLTIDSIGVHPGTVVNMASTKKRRLI